MPDFRVTNDLVASNPAGLHGNARSNVAAKWLWRGKHGGRLCLGGYSYFEYVDIRGHCPEFMGEANSP